MRTLTFTLVDELADKMETAPPDIYFDVYGSVRLRTQADNFHTEIVGNWWRV